MRLALAGLLPVMDVGLSGMQPALAFNPAGGAQTSKTITINVNPPSEPIDYELLTNMILRKLARNF